MLGTMPDIIPPDWTAKMLDLIKIIQAALNKVVMTGSGRAQQY